MDQPKFKILQEVSYKVAIEVDGIKEYVTRKGLIESIKAHLWMGDCYSSGYKFTYNVVDRMYSPSVRRELNEKELQATLEGE